MQFHLNPTDFLILIVDDTEVNVKLLSHVLESQGFSPIVAYNGMDAISIIEEKKPDLVLLDVMMPDMSGFEVCSTINEDEELKEIPVIFLSALSETRDKVEGFDAGGVDYITKPFQKDEVLARIRTHLVLSKLQKERDERIEILRNREIELSKLNKKKDDLVRMVSHDIKNPLTGIVGLANLLQQNAGFSDADKANMLNVMKESGMKLLDLVEEILDKEANAKSVSEVRFTDTDLHDLSDKVISVNKPKAILKDIELTVVKDLQKNPVKLDDIKIEIALNNLISNALKFTPAHGKVELKVKSDQNQICFEVSDTGIGIPQNMIDTILDVKIPKNKKSSTGTDGEIGTGLGLDVVQNYIAIHNGTLSVKSREMEGTTFFIEIPIH